MVLLSPLGLAITELFSVQGRLTNDEGTALTGNYAFEFLIYDSNTAAKNILWSENRTLSVNTGIFNVDLGDKNTTTRLSSVDFNGDLWLGMSVDGEMQSPLLRFTSQGSAFQTIKAKTIDLNTFSNFSDFNGWYESVFDLNRNYYLQQDINAQFVPYAGAIKDLNLGAYGLIAIGDSNFNTVNFDNKSFYSGIGYIDYNGTDLIISG